MRLRGRDRCQLRLLCYARSSAVGHVTLEFCQVDRWLWPGHDGKMLEGRCRSAKLIKNMITVHYDTLSACCMLDVWRV